VPVVTLAVFDVWDIAERRYLNFDEYRDTCSGLGVPVVDLVARGDAFEMTAAELKALACAECYPGTDNVREGIVVRSLVEQSVQVKSRPCRLSFKVLSHLARVTAPATPAASAALAAPPAPGAHNVADGDGSDA
jgi:hypothetical protein